MINYFNYDIPLTPRNGSPFAIYTEVGPSPFSQSNEIAFVRVKSQEIDRSELPSCNLTFLIDTSGSMSSYDKLPLLRQAFGLLVETLTEDDVVSIVTYAGNAAVVLDSVRGNRKDRILDAINGLEAAGSTAGADGINTAYRLAERNFIPGANNRVLLATDGDFNVGISSVSDLEALIRQKRDSGIYLTVLGVGTENLKDNRMEILAKNGNGNYSYLDTVDEAQKVLVDEMGSNLFAIADDVKAQIEFNPAQVESYRLIGYENRMLADRDFNDDTKDAGEIGVGTDVILMFELTRTPSADYRYRQQENAETSEYADELFLVKIRYKDPGDSVSKLISEPVKLESYSDFNTSDFNFAVSVASFGHILSDSEYKGGVTAARIRATALDNLGNDSGNYRKEFIALVEQYMDMVGI
jgi:Ca-activated chloride channel family protein